MNKNKLKDEAKEKNISVASLVNIILTEHFNIKETGKQQTKNLLI